MNTVAAAPAVVPDGAGEAYWWFGSLAIVQLGAGQTGGRFTCLKVVAPPFLEIPLHVHRNEDETFVILQGSATFRMGESIATAGPGDLVYGPRNVPHGYVVGSDPVHMLHLFTPGGFEEFVRATAELAPNASAPPPGRGLPDPERLAAALAAYGGEILEG